jgi:hypothetical protein
MKALTMNRNSLNEQDFDGEIRHISSLLEPEEVKETMVQLSKDLNDRRAINQKFMRDCALTRLNTVREETPGEFTYNTVFDAMNKKIQNMANASKDKDAMPFK